MASKIIAFSPAPLPSNKHSSPSGNSRRPFSVVFPSAGNPKCLPVVRAQERRRHRRWALDASPSGKSSSTDQKWEEEKEFKESFDVAGLSKLEDVKVSIKDETLVIEGEWQVVESGDTETYRWEERTFTSYESSVSPLPDNCDKDKVKAELNNGVLYVTIPKNKVRVTHVQIQ